MQYKSRLLSKPPVAAGGGVHMRIKRRDTPAASTSSPSLKGLALLFFGTQDDTNRDKLRKQQMMKELLIKRALSPPPRRLTLRWRYFQPTPSRLSMMSTA
ncbi:hypothetical protein SOVF_064880 [Spinacia oleracea]|nr:hypothetical protein SOVF_064880 [Spinacia oleracea]